jgi:hypothetical protein
MWTKDEPAEETFRANNSFGAVLVLTVTSAGNVSLTQSGVTQGSIQFENKAAAKAAFQEVGALLS